MGTMSAGLVITSSHREGREAAKTAKLSSFLNTTELTDAGTPAFIPPRDARCERLENRWCREPQRFFIVPIVSS